MVTAALKLLPAPVCSPGLWRRALRSLQAIVFVELKIRLRDTSLPLLLAAAAGCCILLTPSEDAGYAVITFHGMKPVMSASTSLVAAGTVFSLLVFPVYLLGLGVGFCRDRRLGAGVILASSPVDGALLLTARMLANAVLVTLFSLMVLVLVAIVIASRLGSLPDTSSLLAYLLIVIPAALCSLPAATLIDRYLGHRDMAKAGVAFAVWILLILCSVMAWPDVFGLLFLKQNRPAGSESELSMGIIVAQQMPKVAWRTVRLTSSFAGAQFWLMIGAIVTSVFIGIVVVSGMMLALSHPPRYAGAGPATPASSFAGELLRWKPVQPGVAGAAFALARRWLIRARWTWALIGCSLMASVALANSPRVALAAALLIPLTIANASRIRGETSVRNVELSISSLWRPSPSLFTAFVLMALTAIPAAPVHLALPPLRSLHVLVAVAASALWLTWTCTGIARPLLGISVYTLVWYISSFSDIPSSADLLGVAGTAFPSFSAACGLAIIFGLLLLRMDSYVYKPSDRK
jgi:hypothetical protein